MQPSNPNWVMVRISSAWQGGIGVCALPHGHNIKVSLDIDESMFATLVVWLALRVTLAVHEGVTSRVATV